MRLYDERAGVLRDVELRPHMTLYVCGITPYDSAHVGHAFTYVQFDVLVRYLRHLGVAVRHVQNVTDVDDDILRTARERGVDYRDLARRETERFERQMRAIGVGEPTMTPRASEFVPAIVEEVHALLGSGCAYERDGNVYFSVSSFRRYGEVSGLDRDTMLALAGERGGHPEDPRKRDALDFVLWQRSEPGEPWWETPWGRGRPGWHIECSTMARRLLGQPVDIHGGGADLVFPHHESEAAQAEAVETERPFVRHWMHTGMVSLAGDKMSKSLGNLVFVEDLLDRHDPVSIRRALLRHHYRESWLFDETQVETERADLRASRAGERDGTDGATLRDVFFAALDNGLDTPSALETLDRAEASANMDAECARLVEEGRAILGLELPGADSP